MDNHGSPEIKEKRSKIMIEACDRERERFLDSQVGRTEAVLVERKRDGGYFEGYTKNYTPVRIFADGELSGKIVDVKITKAENDWCIGELC